MGGFRRQISYSAEVTARPQRAVRHIPKASWLPFRLPTQQFRDAKKERHEEKHPKIHRAFSSSRIHIRLDQIGPSQGPWQVRKAKFFVCILAASYFWRSCTSSLLLFEPVFSLSRVRRYVFVYRNQFSVIDGTSKYLGTCAQYSRKHH